MSEGLAWILMYAGALFLLLAAVGIFRFPDLYSRMQAATKGATLGIALMLLGVAVYFDDLGVTTRALLVIVFFFLTAPVAAHMLGRAAYILGVPLWEGTIGDELKGRYNLKTHVLRSDAGGAEASSASEEGTPSGS